MFDKNKKCPLFKKKCLEYKCQWYIKIIGTNPQTGQQIDQYGCAVEWLPILLVESSQQQRQTGAAVESFRNEMVEQGQIAINMAQQLPGSTVEVRE